MQEERRPLLAVHIDIERRSRTVRAITGDADSGLSSDDDDEEEPVDVFDPRRRISELTA